MCCSPASASYGPSGYVIGINMDAALSVDNVA
jgi:hypothetical protein